MGRVLFTVHEIASFYVEPDYITGKTGADMIAKLRIFKNLEYWISELNDNGLKQKCKALLKRYQNESPEWWTMYKLKKSGKNITNLFIALEKDAKGGEYERFYRAGLIANKHKMTSQICKDNNAKVRKSKSKHKELA